MLTGHAHIALTAWRMMPGWATANEVLQRGRSDAGTDILMRAVRQDVTTDLLTVAHILLWLSNRGACEKSMLLSSISMVATMRKLIWPLLKRDSPAVIRGRQHLWVTLPGLREQWYMLQTFRLSVTQVSALIPACWTL